MFDLTSTQTPAPARPLMRRALAGLRAALARRRAAREARLAFSRWLSLDARMLEDAGVTREEVDWAAGLPLHVDAALMLRARALERRARGGPR